MTKRNTIKDPTEKTAKSPQNLAKLGQYLKNLRLDLDMSLRKAANLAGISAAHLCKIEQGDIFKSISIDILIRLSRIYGIPPPSIMEEAGLIPKNSNALPELSQYLRSKYSFSPQAIRDLEIAKEVVDKKYKQKAAQLDLF